MSRGPWLTIVGLGEDGPDGLSPASRAAVETAEIVMGPPRHLALIPDTPGERLKWPTPFTDGLPLLKALRGRKVVVLASGDPFWFGAGRAIAHAFDPEEFVSMPGHSTFSLAANRLGWPIEDTVCLGLHATPIERLRPHLSPGCRALVLLRDGAAVTELADFLAREGFGNSRVTALEAIGGARERVTSFAADAIPTIEFAHPLAAAIEVAGQGAVLPLVSGIDDLWFQNDGQITKRPVRALALSALSPRRGDCLWDIGGGSGSIAAEWCLTHPNVPAISIEPRKDRASTIRANAARFGLTNLRTVEGVAPDCLVGLPAPSAVFIGGGLTEDLLADLVERLDQGVRLVAHAVTLETEALLTSSAARHGGDLMRIELSETGHLGRKRGWKAAYPVVQWRVTL